MSTMQSLTETTEQGAGECFDFPHPTKSELISLTHQDRLDLEAALIDPTSFALKDDFEPLPLSLSDLNPIQPMQSMQPIQEMRSQTIFNQTPPCSPRFPLTSMAQFNLFHLRNVVSPESVARTAMKTPATSIMNRIEAKSNFIPSASNNQQTPQEAALQKHAETHGDDQNVESTNNGGIILPKNFALTPDSVIIGRGNTVKRMSGNRRLRKLAESKLPEYSQASRKKEKTLVVLDILNEIRASCPVGSFVKFSNGRWWEVSDAVAREKIGYVLRDLLCSKYSSSSASKTARRKSLKKKAKTLPASSGSEECADRDNEGN